MSPGHTAPPLETAVARATPYLIGGLVVSPFLLLVPRDVGRFGLSIAHLSLLVLLGLAVTRVLAPLGDESWFVSKPWSARRRRLAGLVALVVISTGVVALVTLATSAALRFQPSLQFLQLLSALDITWAAAGASLGAYRLWTRAAADAAGVAVGVVCVLSIWNYMRVVGLAADDGWLLDGGELMRLVIPLDTAAAVVAVVLLLRGAGRPDHTTEQASAQS